MASGTATVKAVLSGDTVILIGRAVNGPPPEMQLTLSFLQAPKLGRVPGVADEPFAWDSRDFLRSRCIGKQVTFKVESQAGPTGRNFGSVKLDGESLAAAVAREGWARVKKTEQGRDGDSEHDELAELGQAAEAGKKGIFTDDPAKKEQGLKQVKWSDVDTEALLMMHKGTPTKATIEHIKDGSSYRVLIHDSWSMVNFNLAGVACPRMNAPGRRPQGAPAPGAADSVSGMGKATIQAAMTSGSGATTNGTASLPPPPAQPEPHAAEAKHFVEMRLLHREVELRLGSVDKLGHLYGSVVHPKGDIAAEILRTGLGRVVDWSLPHVGPGAAPSLRSAENEAKRLRLRLWHSWEPPKIDGDSSYTGQVVEVHSGDQISVLVGAGTGAGVERRIALSSVRGPKVGNPRRGVPDEPRAADSKEFLRKLVIGKTVKVGVDYQRDIPQSNEGPPIKRAFATVTLPPPGKGGAAVSVGGKCLNEVMVAEGLATVMRLRQDDPRSSVYDALVVAEGLARSEKKGLHSTVPPTTRRVMDLCGDSKRAKQFLNTLVRSGTLKGVVEHVFSGSRFKVHVPKENCAFTLAMTEVRCPQAPRAADTGDKSRGRAGDPFGREAAVYSRYQLMQRNVEVTVHDMDKNGVALGNVTVGQGSSRHSYSLDLLKAGLAKLDSRALERAGGVGQSLVSAQEAARAAKLGMWSVEPSEAEKQALADFVVPADLTKHRFCDIFDGGHFYLHTGDGEELTMIEQKLAELKNQVGTSGATMEPRRGTQCAALFNDGRETAWYRARVEGLTPVGVRVRYIDHGNSKEVGMNELRPLDSSYFTFRPQACPCVLAFLRVPTLEEEYGREAAMSLNDMAWGKGLLGRPLGKDEEGRLMMALYETEGSESINELMVSQGVARVARNVDALAKDPLAKDLVSRLKEAQEVAHKNRAAMWRYGDCQSDDEDGF